MVVLKVIKYDHIDNNAWVCGQIKVFSHFKFPVVTLLLVQTQSFLILLSCMVNIIIEDTAMSCITPGRQGVTPLTSAGGTYSGKSIDMHSGLCDVHIGVMCPVYSSWCTCVCPIYMLVYHNTKM